MQLLRRCLWCSRTVNRIKSVRDAVGNRDGVPACRFYCIFQTRLPSRVYERILKWPRPLPFNRLPCTATAGCCTSEKDVFIWGQGEGVERVFEKMNV